MFEKAQLLPLPLRDCLTFDGVGWWCAFYKAPGEFSPLGCMDEDYMDRVLGWDFI